jgi:hypothetical protein
MEVPMRFVINELAARLPGVHDCQAKLTQSLAAGPDGSAGVRIERYLGNEHCQVLGQIVEGQRSGTFCVTFGLYTVRGNEFRLPIVINDSSEPLEAETVIAILQDTEARDNLFRNLMERAHKTVRSLKRINRAGNV